MAKICEACGKEITGACLTADGCKFHLECFKCDHCGDLLKSGFVKKDGKRICQICKPRPVCAGCNKPISGMVKNANGKSYHPDCFKCECCSQVLTRFWTLGEKVVCKDCCDAKREITTTTNQTCQNQANACPAPDNHAEQDLRTNQICQSQSNVSPAPDNYAKQDLTTNLTCQNQPCAGPAPGLKIKSKAPLGSYVGKQQEKPGHHVAFAIKLMDGNRCWMDCTTSSPLSSSAWHTEGTYTESMNADDKLEAIKFTVTAVPFDEGPATGKVFEFAIEKGDPHDILVFEGVRCLFCARASAYEIALMMKAPERMAAPEPAVAPSAPKEKDNSLIVDRGVTRAKKRFAVIAECNQANFTSTTTKTKGGKISAWRYFEKQKSKAMPGDDQ